MSARDEDSTSKEERQRERKKERRDKKAQRIATREADAVAAGGSISVDGLLYALVDGRLEEIGIEVQGARPGALGTAAEDGPGGSSGGGGGEEGTEFDDSPAGGFSSGDLTFGRNDLDPHGRPGAGDIPSTGQLRFLHAGNCVGSASFAGPTARAATEPLVILWMQVSLAGRMLSALAEEFPDEAKAVATKAEQISNSQGAAVLDDAVVVKAATAPITAGARVLGRVATRKLAARRAAAAVEEVEASRPAVCLFGGCPGGGPTCFPAGTPILTAVGVVAIEAVAIGDEVWTWPEEDGDPSAYAVVEVYERLAAIWRLTYVDAAGHASELETTNDHPFWRESESGRGFVAVRELRPGDALRTLDGPARVLDVRPTGRVERVYNLQVDGAHTYLVGEDAVWVHNADYDVALGKTRGLDEFASKVGAKNYRDLKWGTRTGRWQDDFLQALYDDGTKLHVNLDDIEGGPWQAVTRAAARRGDPMDWELYQIYQSPDRWKNITWYEGGSPVTNPFE